MEVTHLGRTGLKVSRICLGTMNFGPQTDEPDAHRIMDRALDAGIQFLDTANVYGWGENRGRTETIVGRWIAQGSRRDRVVLATKVYGSMYDGPNGGRLSAYHIRRACEDSLRRLQTDRIDLYQMHHIDRDTPWDEIWQAMELLVSQGKVLYVGSSNFAAWNIAQANETAARRGFLGLVSEQSLYHLAERSIELEVIPACQAYGVGVIPYSPLGGGLLGGVLKRVASRNDERRGRRTSDRLRKQVEKYRVSLEAYEALCSEIGENPANVAVAWLMSRPGVTSPIIGPRTLDQLEDAIRAEALKLSGEVLGKLDAIWPGPGGQAPEAYAW
jgi:aryl-alcohol dehydrogenase-like predicted oxidoreductase